MKKHRITDDGTGGTRRNIGSKSVQIFDMIMWRKDWR